MQSPIGKRSLLWVAAALLAIIVTACGTTAPTTFTLTVSTTGNGVVVSSPEGIDTSAENPSTAEFEEGTAVTLTADYDATSNIQEWGGACAGVTGDTCELQMTQDLDVSATFTAATAGSFSGAVTVNTDDAEEFVNDSALDAVNFPAGHTYTHSSDLELVYDPQHSLQLVGLRFQTVDIPADAVVTSAQIVFTADGASSGEVTVTIQGQADANPATFADDADTDASGNISGRALTAASVDWTVTDSWSNDVQYATADVSAVIQEIIGLDAWASGNSMAFVLTGSDATDFRRAYSFDANAASAAQIVVEYIAPTP